MTDRPCLPLGLMQVAVGGLEVAHQEGRLAVVERRAQPEGGIWTTASQIDQLAADGCATAGVRERRHDHRAVLRQRARQQIWVPEARSEEHTSELQSLMRISYAVFCLK